MSLPLAHRSHSLLIRFVNMIRYVMHEDESKPHRELIDHGGAGNPVFHSAKRSP
jgi:hypothetical protein